MKKNISFFVFLSIAFSALYFLRDTDLKELISDTSKQRVYIKRNNDVDFMPDWTNEELLLKINIARESAGLSKLKKNTKLDKSAKARLAVILSEDDIDGSITGLSVEKALNNADYDANLVGELILTGFFKSNDPIAYWNSDMTAEETLTHPDFVDLGIAIKNSADKVEIYVLLVSPRKIVKQVIVPKITWGGIELWEAINKRRVEMGVNPLKQTGELCTIASIRLNQLLELGKLDGHAGFVPVLERSDLKWISEKYTISEYLIQGYPTPIEAVKAWENTLGHRSLLAGGEYVWGCVYAQNSFGVAVAAY